MRVFSPLAIGAKLASCIGNGLCNPWATSLPLSTGPTEQRPHMTGDSNGASLTTPASLTPPPSSTRRVPPPRGGLGEGSVAALARSDSAAASIAETSRFGKFSEGSMLTAA